VDAVEAEVDDGEEDEMEEVEVEVDDE
jgi:hypothetical protein